jgi:hypothetical protein
VDIQGGTGGREATGSRPHPSKDLVQRSVDVVGLSGARGQCSSTTGGPSTGFCYPSGHYDATVIAAAQAAGYVGSTTVIPG